MTSKIPLSNCKRTDVLYNAQLLLKLKRPLDAETLLRSSLHSFSQDPKLLELLCLSLMQQGKFHQAEKYSRLAVSKQPNNPLMLCQLAEILTHRGQKYEAIRCYQAAICISPILPEAQYNMAILFRELQQFEHAINAFQDAVNNKPDFYRAYNGLGNTYRDLGDLDLAISNYLTALNMKPGLPTTLINLATALHLKGNTDAALKYYMNAIEINSNNIDAHKGIANTYFETGYFDDAIIHYNKALLLNPDETDAFIGLGNVCFCSDEFESACRHYNKALMRDPDNKTALVNLATALHELGHYGKAAEYYKKVLTMDPDSSDVSHSLGNTLIELGELTAAICHFNHALALEQDNEEYHWDLSRALLLSGDFERGWKEYGWRLKRKSKHLRNIAIPLWKGESLKNKILFVHAEQGIGDEITFASCIPDLVRKSDAVILDCEPRLAPIFQRSFPDVIIHAGRQDGVFDWLDRYPKADYQAPIATLPCFLRPDLDNFRSRHSFLVADPIMKNKWQKLLAHLPNGFSVGISWRGGSNRTTVSKRSVELKHLRRILSLNNIDFIDIQYGDHNSELQSFIQDTGLRMNVFDEIDPLVDIDNFSALIAALDLVITVDNSTAHISGALGVSTYVMLPFSPDWRWLMNGSSCLWYSTVELFRQPEPGNWMPVINQVESSLSRLLDERNRNNNNPHTIHKEKYFN